VRKRSLLSCLILLYMVSGWAATVAITPAQIETDWLRQAEVRKPVPVVSAESDALGGCDGVKTGQWGFHTAHEKNPWWQVDLGAVSPLTEIRVFNRCDNGLAARASHLKVLLSTDGHDFVQAYQHDGTIFLGATDGKPLVIALDDTAARYVKIQLPGADYLHLDEVEVFAKGSDENIARDKVATQSSTSQWSVSHTRKEIPEYDTFDVIAKGRRLAENLRQLGANVDTGVKTLDQIAKHLADLSDNGRKTLRRRLHFDALWAARKMALSNPLLDFDEILFIKRAPTLFPHICDQYYGWFSRGGGGIYILSEFKGNKPQLRCLTEDWALGNFLRPCLSYDGRKVLFAYCKYYPHVAEMPNKVDKELLPEDAFYHIFEMNLDGAGVRQLTRGYYDDFDARYLPNDDIVFLSTRKGTALQAGKRSAQATCEATQPDSYVRCGGGNHRPVAVFTLHAMNRDGGDLRAISAFENFEWTPSVGHDGRIFYARWDYIDRFNGHFMSLWSTNPDGTNAQLVYGNYTMKPQCIFEARPIPNSSKLIFTATAHHSITGGSLVLLDRRLGTEFEQPLTRLTPEVCFPETEGSPIAYYANPWPLSEDHYLVSWADQPLPLHQYMKPEDRRNPKNAAGIYLYDAFGNLNLLYRDPAISSMYPIPIRPRKRPHTYANQVDWDSAQQGRFLVQDVCRGLAGVARGAVKRLRIVGVPPKVQPTMNQPVMGVSAEDPGKFVLGTVPVEEDGSAFFHVPSGISVFFQALGDKGMALQTMRTLTYVQPGQTLSCVGCHESREAAPGHGVAPLAARREPSKLVPGPDGSWPLRFDQLVQPVLNKACVECHRSGGDDEKAARFVLTADKSYTSLIEFSEKDLHSLAFEKDRSNVGDCPARKSKLLALLTEGAGHEGIKLDDNDIERLVTWMDTYAQKQGAFSEAQEDALRILRRDMAALLTE